MGEGRKKGRNQMPRRERKGKGEEKKGLTKRKEMRGREDAPEDVWAPGGLETQLMLPQCRQRSEQTQL